MRSATKASAGAGKAAFDVQPTASRARTRGVRRLRRRLLAQRGVGCVSVVRHARTLRGAIEERVRRAMTGSSSTAASAPRAGRDGRVSRLCRGRDMHGLRRRLRPENGRVPRRLQDWALHGGTGFDVNGVCILAPAESSGDGCEARRLVGHRHRRAYWHRPLRNPFRIHRLRRQLGDEEAPAARAGEDDLVFAMACMAASRLSRSATGLSPARGGLHSAGSSLSMQGQTRSSASGTNQRGS